MRNSDVNRGHPRACRPSDHRERLWDRTRKIWPASGAVSIDRDLDHAATSLGPLSAIATSTATIRVRVDHPTIANVSGTAREKSRSTLFQILYQKDRERLAQRNTRHGQS
jgi:hypothetical protein